MKLNLFLTGLLFFIYFCCPAQKSPEDTLIRYYYQYPQEALKAAREMYQSAQAEHNTPLLIKSLILKTTFTLQKDQDNYPQMLKELEEYTAQETNVSAKSILHSYLGELYLLYYRNNRYLIQQRKYLRGEAPADIAAWSSNLFGNKILEHFSASVSSSRLLQQTPVNEFQSILIRGNASDSLRPTLYDFLVHRAIDQLSQNSSYFERFSVETDMALLADIQVFLRLPVTPEPLHAPGYILKFWQELLRFRLESRQENALLMADLERLNYAYQISQNPAKDSLYLHTLETMHQKFRTNPMVVEIIAQEAALLLRQNPVSRIPYHTNDIPAAVSKATREQVLALCEAGIQQFPHYNRINLLRDLRALIEAPEIQISFPQRIYPGEKLPINISSKNVKEVEIQLYRILATTEQYQNARARDTEIPQALVSSASYALPNDLVPEDTTISLSVPQAGLYKIILKAPGAPEFIHNTFICSQLFYTSQTRHQQHCFQVNDWQSGKPVSHAKILIYRHSNSSGFQPADSVFTDEKGQANYRTPHTRAVSYQVVNPANPNGTIQTSYSFPAREEQETRLTFITDRSIYRPGQMIYFQGITWMATTDTLYPLVHKKINVYLKNPKDQTIAELKVVSDSFGSFSGNFVLPDQLLNGTYRITSDQGADRSVRVEEYKRPEFDIVFRQPQQTYYAGDSVHITGQVKSFSGVIPDQLEVEYKISASYRNDFRIIQGITPTDRQGNFSIAFKTQPQQTGHYLYRISSTYDIQVTVTDAKGETQGNAIQIIAYPGSATPVLSVPQQVNKTDSIPFIVQLDHLPPQAVPRTVHYAIYQLKKPDTLLTALVLPDTLPERMVLKGEFQMTQRDTLFPNLSQEPSGAYLFCVKQGDTETKHVFYLYSPQDKKTPVPTYQWIVPEKTICAPGETAHIQFGTSAQNAYVYYEIYNAHKTLRTKELLLSDEIVDINIPYLAQYGKRIWLTIHYVKDKKYFQETLLIVRKEENCSLTFQTLTFRDHLLPGQQEEWKIRIRTEQGERVPVLALAFMYDASLDKLADYHFYFKPDYLYPYQNFDWKIPYFYEWFSRNSLFFNHTSSFYKYPLFKFDELNTYRPATLIYDCGEYAEDSYAVSAKTMVHKVSQNVLMEPAVRSAQTNGKDRPFPPIEYRKDFQETAFFYPQLQTDSLGDLDIRFKMPQSLTRWKLNILAYTQKMVSGIFTRFITTSKALMVRPNLPRFFRSGDQAVLKVTVSNLSDSLQQGTAGLELFLPDKQKILLKRTTAFRINARGNQTLTFEFRVPEEVGFVGCRIFAENETYSDGEQHLLPVLPNEVLLTETLPIFSAQSGTHSYTLNHSASKRKDYRLTLELSANPIWYAVLALPALTEPLQENSTAVSAAFYVNTIANKIVRSNPEIAAILHRWKRTPGTPDLLSQLEKNSELKSVLLEASPWMLDAANQTEQMQKLTELFDENRLHHLQEQALKQLLRLQNPNGGWGWFKDMYSSRFLTANVLTLMARSITTGDYQATPSAKQMQIKALRYLDKEIMKDYEHQNSKITDGQLLYLYTRSLYRDVPLGDALKAHKYYMDLAQQQWAGFSLYEKAITALAQYNYGFEEIARQILNSLRQYASQTPENGMYWPNNRNKSYRHSAIQTHCAMMEAFRLIEGPTADLNRMKQWLLRQKQVQNWGSVPATVDAIYTLLLTGNDLLAEQDRLSAKWGSHSFTTPDQSNPLGYLKVSYPSSEIRSDLFTVNVTKQKATPSWGGLYWQYFEKLNQVKKHKTEISVDKKLYVEKPNPQGQAELFPVDRQNLKVGDKIVVRLTISLGRDMEFLHLKDLRAGCFEPVQPLSGNQWKFGTVYYQETKDAVTNFFFNALSRGTYVIEYPVWVNQAGTYQDGIASFQSIYAPEYTAFSNTQSITVNP